jgi:hypothetical protein
MMTKKDKPKTPEEQLKEMLKDYKHVVIMGWNGDEKQEVQVK